MHFKVGDMVEIKNVGNLRRTLEVGDIGTILSAKKEVYEWTYIVEFTKNGETFTNVAYNRELKLCKIDENDLLVG